MGEYRAVMRAFGVERVGDKSLGLDIDMPVWEGDCVPDPQTIRDLMRNPPSNEEVRKQFPNIEFRSELVARLKADAGEQRDPIDALVHDSHLQAQEAFLGLLGDEAFAFDGKDRPQVVVQERHKTLIRRRLGWKAIASYTPNDLFDQAPPE